jgi:2-keto-4-pentenoate hydratase/2-oxohepta-3-ene-1,7-dioic acid hydratase in catechol pathway
MEKLICAGKNYLDHAAEMGEGTPERPVLFLKPPSVLQRCSAWDETITLQLPSPTDEIHYECELVFKIVQQKIAAVTVGLDMTNRTLQQQAKQKGGPWTLGKVFKDAACIGPWLDLPADWPDLSFGLEQNGIAKQQAYAREMRMNPQELLDYAAAYFPICEGDLLFTGTPAGVGPVKAGDSLTLRLDQHRYSVKITA